MQREISDALDQICNLFETILARDRQVIRSSYYEAYRDSVSTDSKLLEAMEITIEEAESKIQESLSDLEDCLTCAKSSVDSICTLAHDLSLKTSNFHYTEVGLLDKEIVEIRDELEKAESASLLELQKARKEYTNLENERELALKEAKRLMSAADATKKKANKAIGVSQISLSIKPVLRSNKFAAFGMTASALTFFLPPVSSGILAITSGVAGVTSFVMSTKLK